MDAAQVRELVRALLLNIPESEWGQHATIVAAQMRLATESFDLAREADVARRDRDAKIAAAEEDAQLARPAISPDKPLRAVVKRGFKTGGREYRRGEEIDLGQSFWPAGRISQMHAESSQPRPQAISILKGCRGQRHRSARASG